MNTQVRLQNSLFRLAGLVNNKLVDSRCATRNGWSANSLLIFTGQFNTQSRNTATASCCLWESQNLSKHVITCQSNLSFCVDKEKENPAKTYRGLPQASHGTRAKIYCSTVTSDIKAFSLKLKLLKHRHILTSVWLWFRQLSRERRRRQPVTETKVNLKAMTRKVQKESLKPCHYYQNWNMSATVVVKCPRWFWHDNFTISTICGYDIPVDNKRVKEGFARCSNCKKLLKWLRLFSVVNITWRSQNVSDEILENILQLTPTVRSAFLCSDFSSFCICWSHQKTLQDFF